jgi:hypothetical protein
LGLPFISLLAAIALPQTAAAQVSPPQVNIIEQSPAPIRLTFGMVSRNRPVIESALAPEVLASIMNMTLPDRPTETHQGAVAVTTFITDLDSLTGGVRNANCTPGVPGKYYCEYEVVRGDRQLVSLIDLENDRITSLIFLLGPGDRP